MYFIFGLGYFQFMMCLSRRNPMVKGGASVVVDVKEDLKPSLKSELSHLNYTLQGKGAAL